MKLGLVIGLAEASADSVPLIPLAVCSDGITQNYSGFPASITLSRIDYDVHVNLSCGNYTKFNENTGGMLES